MSNVTMPDTEAISSLAASESAALTSLTRSETDSDEMRRMQRRLRIFLKWIGATAGLFMLENLIYLIIEPNWLDGTSLISFIVFFVLFFWAYREVQRGNLSRASVTLCISFFGFSIFDGLISVGGVYILFVPLLGLMIALPYVTRKSLHWLLIGTFATLLIDLLLWQVNLFADPIITSQLTFDIEQGVLRISAAGSTLALVLLLLNQFHQQLTDALAKMRSANQGLQTALSEVEERSAAQAELLNEVQRLLQEEQAHAAAQARLLAENQQQRATIRALSVPVIPIAAATLVMPLVGALDAERLNLLEEQALGAIEQAGAQTLLIDTTGVLLIDSDVAAGLIRIVNAARLLGAEVLLVGIRPEVAQAIVNQGLGLENLRTAATLQDGLNDLAGRRTHRHHNDRNQPQPPNRNESQRHHKGAFTWTPK